MKPDCFERNIRKLLLQAALPVDDERKLRARAAFLRAAETAPDGRSRALALTAATLLIGALLYGAARRPADPDTSPPPSAPGQDSDPVYITVRGIDGGLDRYKGELKMSREARPLRKFRFEGRSSMMDGVVLRVTSKPMTLSLEKGVLVDVCREPPSTTLLPQNGAFTFEWESRTPDLVLIEISAPEVYQDQAVLQQLKGVADGARSGTLRYHPFDERWRALFEPQLSEVSDFAREARDLITRVEVACSSEEFFKSGEKAFTAEAARLQTRIERFETAGFYPASAQVLACTVRDLASSLKNFVFREGKFDGPSSYYTPSKRGTTFRGDPFDFSTLRGYVDESILVAEHEFDLLILREIRFRGLLPEIVDRVARLQKRAGIDRFAIALKKASLMDAEGRSILLSGLEETTRTVSP
jgi:hypothetical protein